MKKFLVIIVGLALVSCAKNPQAEPQVDSSQTDQTSSISAVPKTSSSSFSEVQPYVGPFKKTENGEFIGTITVKGFPVREPACITGGYDEPCTEWTPYVFFKITDGMTPIVQEFLTQYEGNSFVQDDAIGLGCETSLSEDQNNAVILNANSASPITLTLNRPFEPEGRGVPSCFSHFEIVSATR